MISIRLKRNSSKRNLTFAIIVVWSTESPKSGNFVEKIGFYRPLADVWSNKYLFIDIDRLLYWLKRGAKLNNSVFSLIRPLILSILRNK